MKEITIILFFQEKIVGYKKYYLCNKTHDNYNSLLL